MVKGAPSVNPSGRPKVDAEFRQLARGHVDKLVLKAWVKEIESEGPNWMKASELMTAYAYGKPKDSLELSQDPDAPVNEFAKLTHEQLEAIALHQMEKMSKQTP